MPTSGRFIAQQLANASINQKTWGDAGVNIRVYDATGDGETNDTDAIIAADALGKTLFVPDGVYISDYTPVNPVTGPGTILVNGSPVYHHPVGVRPAFYEQYRKRIALKLPIRSPYYNTIVSTYTYNYIYPQAFTIDEVANEIVIAYQSDGGSNTWQWVSVFDWLTGEHKRSFSAGGSIGEGIYIEYVGGTRYLYLRADASDYIAKFDITTLPANLARLVPVAEYNADLYASFTARNGTFYIESHTHPVGSKYRRNHFNKFASDLTTRKGTVTFSIFDTGDLNEYFDYIPKRQTIAVGDGFFVGGYGSIYGRGDTKTDATLQGIRVFDESGARMRSCLLDPVLMMDVLEDAGIACTRIENEGICVTKDNRIFSLAITQNATDPTVTTLGIIIFEEMSSSRDSIDFIKAAVVPPAFPDLTQYYPPRTQGSMLYNPITGGKFTTMNEIMDFMIAVDCRTFEYYSTSAPGILDISGVALPNSSHIAIFNMNNGTYFYSIKSSSRNDYYLVNGTPRAQTKALFPMEGRPAASVTPASNGDFAIQATSNTQVTFKFKGSDGVVRSANLTLA